MSEDDTPRMSVNAFRTLLPPELAQVAVPEVAQQKEVVWEEVEAAPLSLTPSRVAPLAAYLALTEESYENQLVGNLGANRARYLRVTSWPGAPHL